MPTSGSLFRRATWETRPVAIERSKAAGILLAAGAVVAVIYFYSGRTPQVGSDDESFRTLDALYTAVTSRNLDRLSATEARLKGLREQNRLPAPAADRIDAIISQARSGEWLPAAKELHAFVSAQRR